MGTLTEAVEQTEVGTELIFVGEAGSKLNTEDAPTYRSASSRTYEKLMTEYRSVLKDSAETIIKRAEILKQANEQLGDNELSHTFEDFCKELLGLHRKHSTVRKMVAIGAKAERFYPVLDRLPHNWTTIDRLAKLSEEQFVLVTEDDRFTPKMTAKDIEAICPPKPKKAKKPGKGKKVLSIVVKVTLADLDGDKKQELRNRLHALTEDFGLEIKGDLELLKSSVVVDNFTLKENSFQVGLSTFVLNSRWYRFTK